MGKFYATKNKSTNSGNVFRATKNRSYDAAHAIRAEAAEKKRQEEMNGSYFEKSKSRFADYDALRAINPTALGSTAKERADAFKTKTAVINHNKSKLSNYDNLRPVNPTAVGSTPQERASALKNKTGIIEKNLEGKYGSLPFWDKLKKANELPYTEAKRLRGYAYRTASAEDLEDAIQRHNRVVSRFDDDREKAASAGVRYSDSAWNEQVERTRGIYSSKNELEEQLEKKKAEKRSAKAAEIRNKIPTMSADEIRAEIENGEGNTVAYVDESGNQIRWSTLYYEAENRETLAGMTKAQRALYDDALKTDEDLSRLYDFSQSSDPVEKRSDYAYFVSKYGNEFDYYYGLDELKEYISSLLDDKKRELGSQGIDYERLSEYESRRKEMAESEELAESYKLAARDYPALSTAAAILAAPAKAVDFVKGATSSSGSEKDLDTFVPATTSGMGITNFEEAVYSSVAEKIDAGIENDFLSWLATAVYSGGTSVLSSSLATLPAAAAGLPSAGLAMLGTQAAASSLKSAIDNGATAEQAVMTGIASGLAEAAFEKIPLDEILKTKSINYGSLRKNIIEGLKNAVKQGAIEAGEETLTELYNFVASEAISNFFMFDGKGTSEYDADVARYMSQGYNEDQAKEKAKADFFVRVAEAAVGGFVAGAPGGGARSAVNIARSNSTREELTSVFKTIDALYAESGKESDGEFASALMNLYESGDVGVYADTMRLYYKTGLEGGDVGAIEERFGSKADKNSTLRARAEAYRLGAAARQRVMSDNADSAVLADKELSGYTPEKRAELQRYFDSADQRIIDFYNAAIERGVSTKETIELSPVSERAAADIYEVTGVKVSGFKTSFGSTAALHIDKRHGTSGEQDHSMADVRDVARIQYVLDNYDDISYEGTSNAFTEPSRNGKSSKNAKTVVFTKKINGTYYVVEAVPETNKKTVHIVSAYINKKGAQRPVGANAENGVHPRNVRNVTTDTPVNSIAESVTDVKEENPTTAKGGPPPFDKGGYAAKDRTGRLDENARTVFDAIGRAFDVDVEYVESLDDGSWGRMETALHRMTISAESANPLSTAIHEQVHLMKVIAPEAYKALERYTMWALDQEGADVDSMINRKIALYEGEAGFGYDEAVEELVCDATENIQNADDFEGRFAQFLSEKGCTHSEAKAVAEKIAEFFRKIRDALKSVLDSLRARHGDNVTVTEAGAALSANIDVANRQLELFLALSRMSKQRYAEIRAGMVDMPEGAVKKMIVTLGDGKQYVHASEDVIRGNDPEEWAAQVARYINSEIRAGHDFDIKTVEGDILTITRDTAYKSGSRNKITNPDGTKRDMTDTEYRVKLNAEVHINELSEISKKTKQPIVPDSKKHRFAKDGFQYRTVYFMDYDGQYYRLTLSVGVNGHVNTVYNVGKIRKDMLPKGNIKTQLSGSKANNISSENSISQNAPRVNRKSQKAPDSAEVEKLKAQVAKRDGRISQQSEVIDKLKTVVERGDAGTIPYEKLRSGMKSILREYSSKYSLETAAARASEIFGRIKNVSSSVEQRAIYRDVLALARDITSAAEAKTKDSAAFTADCAAFLKDVRKGIAITETQKQDLAAAYGSFSKARNAFMGRVTFKNDGVSLDAVWETLRGYDIPYSLPSQNEVSEGDMIHELLRAVEAVYDLKNGTYNPIFEDEYGNDSHPDRAGMEAKTNERLATRLFDMLADTPELRNADAAARQAYARAKREYNRAMDYEKERMRQTRNALIDETKAQRREFYEKKRASELRARISREVNRITTALTNPKGDRYIPEFLREPVVDMLGCFMDSGVMASDTVRRIDRFRTMYEGLQLGSLQASRSVGAEEYVYSRAYDEGMSAALLRVAKIFADKTVSELGYNELNEVWGVVNDVVTRISEAKKSISIARGEDIVRLGESFIADIAANGKLLSKANYNNLNPYRILRTLGGFADGSAGTRIAEAFRRGWVDSNSFKMKANGLFDTLVDQRKQYKRFVRERIDVGLIDDKGKPAPISRAMMVQIYLIHQREEASGYNINHLELGGVVIPEEKALRVGDMKKAFDNGQRVLSVGPDVINRITDELRGSDYCYAWIDACRSYYGDMQYRELNKLHLSLFHRMMPKSKDYFPLNPSRSYIYQENAETVAFNASFENAGFYKNTISHAPQPLNIAGVDEVVNDSIEETANQVGYALPVSDVNALLNVRVGVEDSVRDRLAKLFPGKNTDVLTQYITDLARGREKARSRAYELIRSAFITKSISFNTSVCLGQLSAYYAAGGVISGNAIFKAQKDLPKVLARKAEIWEKLDKYTPIIWTRRQGLSSTELAELNKIKSLPEIMRMGTKWSQKTDVLCTTWIAQAAIYDVDAKILKGELKIERDGEEYWKEVARLLEDAVFTTQDMHDPLFMPEFLKDTNELKRAAALYQTQTFQMHGALLEAFTERKATAKIYAEAKSALDKARASNEDLSAAESNLKRAEVAYNTARSKFAKMAGAVTVQAVIYRILKIAMSFALRKVNPFRDDEGELTAQSVTGEFSAYVVSDVLGILAPTINAYGGFENLRDTLGLLLNGSDVNAKKIIDTAASVEYENPTISTLTDFISSAKNVAKIFTSEDENPWNHAPAFYKLLKQGVQLTGIPLQNAENVVTAISGFIKDMKDGRLDYDDTYEQTASQIYDVMYEAMLKGDEKKLEKYRERALENKLDYSAIDNGIASRLQDHPTLQEYAEAYDESDWEEYDRLYGELKKFGFKDDVIFSARDGYLRSLLPDKVFAAGEDDDGTKKEYDTEKLVDAIGERDVETVDRIIEWYEGTGKNPRASITKTIKPDWRALDTDGRTELEDFLIDHCGYKEDYDFDEWILEYDYEDLYDAIDAKDADGISKIFENFAEAGRDEKDVREAVKKHYRDLYKDMDGDERYALKQFLIKNCNFPEKYPFHLWLNKN